MRTYPKIKIIKTAHHRNGVGGVPFNVTFFKDLDENKTMIAIQFDSDEPNDIHTAVFDFNLLKDGVIDFFENSWRGDVYHAALKVLTEGG
jgi:hypothetical protein